MLRGDQGAKDSGETGGGRVDRPECIVHDRVAERWGSEMMTRDTLGRFIESRAIVLDRVFKKIEISEDSDCLFFTGAINKGGYGIISRNKRARLAHRVLYELSNGKIPDGLVLDHLCRNRNCVNPNHLRVVTLYQNSTENSVSGPAINKVKTHCIRVHKFGIQSPSYQAKGKRRCMECHKETEHVRHQSKRRTFKDQSAIIFP